MAARDLIIIRTYKADPASLAAYDLYAALEGYDITFCVDERAAVADMGARHKITFDNARLEELGLYPHPDCGWQCGDYCYHVTRAAKPGYAFYWLVEPDVKINVADLSEFFGRYATNPADLLAPRLTFNDHTWSWTKEIAATGLPPWRCFYPLTRLSGRAIDHVHATRRKHTLNPAIAAPKAWPNDEGITASALADGDFVCQDLNQNGILCHTGASLNGVALIDPDVLAAQPPDGLIYHPVRNFASWFAINLATMIAIERDQIPETGLGRIAGRAINLSRIAQTCLRNPDYIDASLMPLLLAQHLWDIRPDIPNITEFTRTFHMRTARLNMSRINESFGVNRHRKQICTAQVVTSRPTAIIEANAATHDFTLGEPIPLGRFPRTVAIPYAWDLETRELLLSTHLDVEHILAEPNLKQAQRHFSRVMVRAPCIRLSRLYADSKPEGDLLVCVAQDDEIAEQLATSLRRARIPVIASPGALLQLADAMQLLGEPIKHPAFFDMIRHSLIPFLHLRCAHAETSWRAIILPPLPARFLTMLVRVFPSARYTLLRSFGQVVPPSLAHALSHAHTPARVLTMDDLQSKPETLLERMVSEPVLS